MPRIADYLTLRDAFVELTVSGSFVHTENFSLESGAITAPGEHHSRPVLMMIARPHQNASNLVFRAIINAIEVAEYTFSGFRYHTLHEVFPANLLNATGNNTLDLRADSGTGAIDIGDVVLLYQRTITSSSL
jgi:hypothetical protein